MSIFMVTLNLKTYLMITQTFNIRHFLTLFDNANSGIIVVNTNGTIEAANKYIFRTFGYNKKELLHKTLETLIPERLRENHKNLWVEFSKDPVNVAIDLEKNLQCVKKNGTEFNVEMSLGFYKCKSETYFVAFVIDPVKRKKQKETISLLNGEPGPEAIERTRSVNASLFQLSRQMRESERKHKELLKVLEKEKELNALKSSFVSVASHEFRTPLSGILASTYLLSKYTKENEQEQRDKHIKRILSSVNLLNEVLGEFLSVDKIEQGNFQPNLTVFDLGAAATEIIQNMQHMLKAGQRISFRHDRQTGIAYMDQSMLNHILTNLLSNAIKYSPEESNINLAIEQKEETLTINVKDYGIGIPKKEQENLYKRFFRSSNVAQIQGTGLGLNIVKKYVDILNGTIDCISEENKGTEFIIRFNNQKGIYANSISS
jgi:PAS domain S-box-containing protein